MRSLPATRLLLTASLCLLTVHVVDKDKPLYEWVN